MNRQATVIAALRATGFQTVTTNDITWIYAHGFLVGVLTDDATVFNLSPENSGFYAECIQKIINSI